MVSLGRNIVAKKKKPSKEEKVLSRNRIGIGISRLKKANTRGRKKHRRKKQKRELTHPPHPQTHTHTHLCFPRWQKEGEWKERESWLLLERALGTPARVPCCSGRSFLRRRRMIEQRGGRRMDGTAGNRLEIPLPPHHTQRQRPVPTLGSPLPSQRPCRASGPGKRHGRRRRHQRTMTTTRKKKKKHSLRLAS